MDVFRQTCTMHKQNSHERMLCLMGKKRKAPTKAKAWMRMQAAELADNNIYEKIKDKFLDDMPDEVWMNDRYQATIRYLNKDLGRDGICQMCIHSHTRATNRPWRHFQQIKNDVFGDEREALELYPAESRVVDTANEYHLWVWTKDSQIPVGFQERNVRYDIGDDDPEVDAHLKNSRAKQAPKMQIKENSNV